MKQKVAHTLLFLYAASTFISVAAMSIGYVILLICTAFLFSWIKFKNHLSNPFIRRYLILTLGLITASLISITRQKLAPFEVYGKVPSVQYWAENKKFFYLFNPILLSYILSTLGEKSVFAFIRYHWLALLGIGVVGFFQFFTGVPHSEQTPEIISGLITYQTTIGLGLTHSVSSNLSITVFTLISTVILKPEFLKELFKLRPLQSRLTWIFVALLILFVITMVFARSAWITVPVGICAIILLGFRRRTALITISALVALLFASTQIPAIKNRLLSQTGQSDRIAIWMGNIELFKTNPLFGVGWRQSSKLVDGAARHYYSSRGEELPAAFFPGHAHSVYLEMLSTTGLVGLFAFLIWSFYIFSLAWRSRKDSPYGFWSTGFFVGMMVIYLNGIIQVNFWDSKVLHQIMLQLGIFLTLLNCKKSQTNFNS